MYATCRNIDPYWSDQWWPGIKCLEPSGGDGYSDSYKTLHTELGYEFLTFRTRIKMRQQVLLSLVDKLMMVKINFTIATDCIPASKSGKPKQINTALPYYQTLDGIELWLTDISLTRER